MPFNFVLFYRPGELTSAANRSRRISTFDDFQAALRIRTDALEELYGPVNVRIRIVNGTSHGDMAHRTAYGYVNTRRNNEFRRHLFIHLYDNGMVTSGPTIVVETLSDAEFHPL